MAFCLCRGSLSGASQWWAPHPPRYSIFVTGLLVLGSSSVAWCHGFWLFRSCFYGTCVRHVFSRLTLYEPLSELQKLYFALIGLKWSRMFPRLRSPWRVMHFLGLREQDRTTAGGLPLLFLRNLHRGLYPTGETSWGSFYRVRPCYK